MIGYHVTTPKKLLRYESTGAILPPVRFWRFGESAARWARRTGRTVILRIEAAEAYPLPDHHPRGHAWWTPDIVRGWEVTP
jgi:hypothetical protein